MSTPKMNAGALAGSSAPSSDATFRSMPKPGVVKDKQVSTTGGTSQHQNFRSYKPAHIVAGKRHPAKNNAGNLGSGPNAN